MAPRSFWKGYLKLSLVTCPIALTPAVTEKEKVRFHTINRKTGNRIVSRYVDEASGAPVDDDRQVKGYARGGEDFIQLENEELDAVALESSHTIDIDMFTPRREIDWIWFDKPHYLTPSDPVGEEAFCVIRDAMAASDMVGISRVVMYQRERAVLLEPRDKGIVLWTLRYGDEVRDPQAYFSGLATGKPETELMTLIKSLIEERKKPWDRSMMHDPVQGKLVEIIETKKQGKKKPAKPPTAPPNRGNVVNIMDALRKSLAETEKSAKRR